MYYPDSKPLAIGLAANALPKWFLNTVIARHKTSVMHEIVTSRWQASDGLLWGISVMLTLGKVAWIQLDPDDAQCMERARESGIAAQEFAKRACELLVSMHTDGTESQSKTGELHAQVQYDSHYNAWGVHLS
jgi:hypothetical protein